ncbi:hypothetical protein DACRYDRAFT_20380, partial [Dacryopinax primogenitus]
ELLLGDGRSLESDSEGEGRGYSNRLGLDGDRPGGRTPGQGESSGYYVSVRHAKYSFRGCSNSPQARMTRSMRYWDSTLADPAPVLPDFCRNALHSCNSTFLWGGGGPCARSVTTPVHWLPSAFCVSLSPFSRNRPRLFLEPKVYGHALLAFGAGTGAVRAPTQANALSTRS